MLLGEDDSDEPGRELMAVVVEEDDCSPPEAGVVVEGLPVAVIDAILEELKVVNVDPERAEGVLEAIVVAETLVDDAIGAVKFGLGARVC